MLLWNLEALTLCLQHTIMGFRITNKTIGMLLRDHCLNACYHGNGIYADAAHAVLIPAGQAHLETSTAQSKGDSESHQVAVQEVCNSFSLLWCSDVQKHMFQHVYPFHCVASGTLPSSA